MTRRIFARAVFYAIVVSILGACAVSALSCAQTTITGPDGWSYTSTRDTNIGRFVIVKETRADGTGSVRVEVDDASGGASTVIDAQSKLAGAVVSSAITAGIRSQRALGP